MTNRIATTAAIILSLAAAGTPAASARPADYVPASHQAPASVYGRPDKSMIPAMCPRQPARQVGPIRASTRGSGHIG